MVTSSLTTIVLFILALALGAWEITRHGGPKRKDLLVVVLGFVGLSFIVIVGYLASDATLLARR